MDTKLRELERRAASGDPEAEKRFLMEKLRSGNYYPVLLRFYEARSGLAELVTCGRMFDGYDHSARLKTPGLGETRNCGPMIPVDGILRSVSVSVNYVGMCNYTIEICDVNTLGPGFDWNKVLAKSIFSSGVKVEVNRDIYARIPGGTPLGVRIGGDQSSTFSAICVTLEIWIPGSV